MYNLCIIYFQQEVILLLVACLALLASLYFLLFVNLHKDEEAQSTQLPVKDYAV